MVNNILLIALILLTAANIFVIFKKGNVISQIGCLFLFLMQVAFLILAFYDNQGRIDAQTIDLTIISCLLILGNGIVLFGYIQKQSS